jgi:hypothetical protein
MQVGRYCLVIAKAMLHGMLNGCFLRNFGYPLQIGKIIGVEAANTQAIIGTTITRNQNL